MLNDGQNMTYSLVLLNEISSLEYINSYFCLNEIN